MNKKKILGIIFLIISAVFLTMGLIFGIVSLITAFKKSNINIRTFLAVILPCIGIIILIYLILKLKKEN